MVAFGSDCDAAERNGAAALSPRACVPCWIYGLAAPTTLVFVPRPIKSPAWLR